MGVIFPSAVLAEHYAIKNRIWLICLVIQRRLPIVLLKLPVDQRKIYRQYFGCCEEIFAHYCKKFSWTGSSVGVYACSLMVLNIML
jgi:hypothetical protein